MTQGEDYGVPATLTGVPCMRSGRSLKVLLSTHQGEKAGFLPAPTSPAARPDET